MNKEIATILAFTAILLIGPLASPIVFAQVDIDISANHSVQLPLDDDDTRDNDDDTRDDDNDDDEEDDEPQAPGGCSPPNCGGGLI